MSYGARATKTSAQSPKKKSVPARKKTRSSVQKKSSPKKNPHEQASSSTLTEPRQKRLSSLTAATLLQYCSSILSPARKLKSTPKKTIKKSTPPRKRQLSNVSENNKPELNIPTRTRREASSRASAMIMQQNEIERSRYSYSVVNERSTSTIQRHRSKNTIPNKDEIPTESFKFNIPTIPPLPIPTPSIADISNQTEYVQPPSNIITTKTTHSLPTINLKYPSLTEALLAEHNRVQEKLTNKHDNLLKWTQELALCGRLSPPYPADEIPPESSTPINTKEITTTLSIANPKPMNSHPTSTFLFPSSTYSLDLRSFYPLLPCWQYPSWPFQPTNYPIQSSSSTATIHSKTSVIPKKKPTLFNSIHKEKKKDEALTLHLHTHHHHHIHNSNSTIQPLEENNVQALNLSINSKKTTRRKSSPVKRRINSGTKIHSSPIQSINDKIPQKINTNENEKSPRRILKRRSVSAAAAATNSTTIISITGKHSRRTRANSAINGKRSYSPASSLTLPLSRKKQKISHYWILFGKSEQKLVSIHADKPPVFRECYSSIRHTTEKDVIKSNDCVILRSDTGTRSTYLAKVKWFWKEPITDEIQMSLIWYYHPEHTELPLHTKNQFLPNELLASKYWDCISVECIEDKCYVLNFNEYNRYYLREKSVNLFDHSESVGQLKFLLNKNIPAIHHRLLPAKTVGNQNIFFCRYVYDYRVKRILKNPTFVTTASSV